MIGHTDPHEIAARLTGPGGEFEIVEEDVLGVRMPVFRNRPTSLAALLAAPPGPGERDYLVAPGRRLSYARHAEAVGSLAHALATRYGIGKGDRVAILAANSPEWVVAFWATVSLGAICVAHNAWWATPEIRYALDHSKPGLLFTDAKRAARLPGGLEIPVLTIETDLPELADGSARPPAVEIAEDDPAVIVYTSGTTGRPKGVTHSHRNMLATALYHRLMKAIGGAVNPAASAAGRWLLGLPLFHIAGLHNLVVPRLATGETVVMATGAFDPHRVLELVARERVTNWTVVPTMAHRIAALGPAEIARYDLSSLVAFGLASAPSSPELHAQLRALIPAARQALVNSYGLTESCTGATVAAPPVLAEDPATVGAPIPTVAVQVRDPSGAVLPDGMEGEIWVRSQFNMLGYWDDPAATEAIFNADRWMRTGDLGWLRGGLLYLRSRRDDLILRGGENVSPVEVEHCLDQHPAVAESAVLGLEHPELGQEVGAIVVTAPGATVAEPKLRDYAADRLAYYKVPSRWHITSEPLPRNATGKVVRAGLERSFIA